MKTYRRQTKLIRAGLNRSAHKETAEAIYMTSGFVYDSAEEADARFAGTAPGYLYGRYANPTQRMFEERLAALEEAEDCVAVGSGMAAVTAALMAPCQAGDHVVASRALFSSCLWLLDTLLPRYGVKVSLVDGEDLNQWEAACRGPVKLALLETPSNPTLRAVDIAAVSAIVRAAGGLTIVDNVFASPVLQQPLQHGADLVVYSATKHMDGQGRTLGGALVGSKKLLDETYREFIRHTGPALSPFNAWVLVKGLETIALRVDAQSASAAKLADLIAASGKVARVSYPTRADHPDLALHQRQMRAGGTLVCIEMAGGRAAAFRFLNALEIVDISNNLGDAKSLAAHPETTTHRRLTPEDRARIGITGGTLRLSVGLEDVDDLAEDITAALEQA
jgi:O-succinylhomoserine sulfhydrylase